MKEGYSTTLTLKKIKNLKVRKRNNIIIGDLIIDINYLLELSGKSAEFNAKKI